MKAAPDIRWDRGGRSLGTGKPRYGKVHTIVGGAGGAVDKVGAALP